jgi:hypothetical protein
MQTNTDTATDFRVLIEAAYKISEEIGNEVNAILVAGCDEPLEAHEAANLLRKVVVVLRDSAERRSDKATVEALAGDVDGLLRQLGVPDSSHTSHRARTAKNEPKLELQGRNGIAPAAVRPAPVFHMMEVPMNAGFVKTSDIKLWEDNVRLDIFINQFEEQNGRKPTSHELLDIMLRKLQLPGVSDEDQFKIPELAESIANNGVRRPPILDLDGTPLDGNRRIAASQYILSSDGFTPEQKKRVEYIYVWQLTEHATDVHREAVVVALNFEPDCKRDWPEYVKARKVYEAWQEMLSLEPRTPSGKRLTELKRELAKKFALVNDMQRINRYIKMVDWANEFEEFHVNVKHRDHHEAKHRADEYFQYFDELGKGTKPGSVAVTLNHDEALKHLVFDLLFQRKFKNWNLVRDLKYYDKDCFDELLEAQKMPTSTDEELERAQDFVEEVLTATHARNAKTKIFGANERIKQFVDWLEELPVSAFRDVIEPDNLQALLRAFQLIKTHCETTATTAT